MIRRFQLGPWAWGLSVIFHVMLVVALTVNWAWHSSGTPAGAGGTPELVAEVQVPLITDQSLKEEVERLQQESTRREEAAIGLRAVREAAAPMDS